MTTVYEVWDTETANRIGAFPTLADAEGLLRDVLRVNGPEVAREMAVLAYSEDSDEYEPILVLEGATLVAQSGRATITSRDALTACDIMGRHFGRTAI